jgi:hypothetical protein
VTTNRACLILLAASLASCTPTAALMTSSPTVKYPAGRADETTGGVAFSAGGLGSSATGASRLQGESVLVPDVLLPQFVLALLSALP